MDTNTTTDAPRRTGPKWPARLGLVLLLWVVVAGIVNGGWVPPLGILVGVVGAVLLLVGLVLRLPRS